ncbi:MAG: DNA ligase D [Thermoanaerobaculia bacterium]
MTKARTLLEKLFPPMLATLTDAPPKTPKEWTWELKYDGFRAVAAKANGEIALLSRNELDLAPRFPSTAATLAKLKVAEAVFDGEVIIRDEKGAPRFQLLQQGSGGGREEYVVFDVLWLDGEDLRGRPYLERRKLLEKLLRRPPKGITLSEIVTGDGVTALADAAKNGYEGLIAKRNSSVYESRRSKEWLKLKAINQQELVVIGWQPSTHSDREIGSLHLAVNEDGKLRYAGKVGTGFSYKQRVWFREALSADVIDKAPAADAPRIRTATWVRPRLVAQVSFTEWTSDGRLRHPSFLGLREDKPPAEVVKETSAVGAQPAVAKKATKSSTAKKRVAPTVTLTNPSRLLYPRDGLTKQELADYYAAVAGPMLTALADRPLALEHWNQGIDRPSWFHQNLGPEGPAWLSSIDTPTRTSRRTVRHLAVDGPQSLQWLAQMSVLTVHMWSSRGAELEQPDWIVFDLDPAKGKGIEQAIEAAIIMRRLLEQLELPSVPKTSGKRGIHVLVPLVAGYTHEQAAEFAGSIAAAVTAKVPTMTVERSLAKRRGRLYLDWLQNGYGKTVVAPYSPRAIDGAPVSAPLEWSEVTKKLDPLKYNVRTMPNRLAKKGDLFARVFEERAKLPQLK